MEAVALSRKNERHIIEGLRQRAKQDDLFTMVCKKFAYRIRNRDYITVGALRLSMSKDGLNFPSTKYVEILRFLSELGLGRLDYNKDGSITGLIRIPMSLSWIGKVALTGRPDEIDHKANKGTTPTEELEEPKEETATNSVKPTTTSNNNDEDYKLKYSTVLTITVKGNEVVFPGPEINATDLGSFLLAFSAMANKAAGHDNRG